MTSVQPTAGHDDHLVVLNVISRSPDNTHWLWKFPLRIVTQQDTTPNRSRWSGVAFIVSGVLPFQPSALRTGKTTRRYILMRKDGRGKCVSSGPHGEFSHWAELQISIFRKNTIKFEGIHNEARSCGRSSQDSLLHSFEQIDPREQILFVTTP